MMNKVITHEEQLLTDRRIGELKILTTPAFEAYSELDEAPRVRALETIRQGLRRRADVVIASTMGILASSIALPWAMSELGTTNSEAASLSILTSTIIAGGSIALHGYLGDKISYDVKKFPNSLLTV